MCRKDIVLNGDLGVRRAGCVEANHVCLRFLLTIGDARRSTYDCPFVTVCVVHPQLNGSSQEVPCRRW